MNSTITKVLWQRGDLRFLMKPKQVELRNFFHSQDEQVTVANAHRQFGKSTCMFAMCLEQAIQKPNQVVKYGAPTAKQAREIIQVVQNTVLNNEMGPCPIDIQFNKTLGEFNLANGSIVKLIGVDDGGGEKLRGSPAHLVVLDEAGFMENLDYLYDSVVEPQFLRTNGRLIMISTPSTALVHPFIDRFIPQAKIRNSYWCLPITDNPDFTKRQIDKLASTRDILNPANGEVLKSGYESEYFQREYMVKIIPDSERLVIPEWQLQKSHCTGVFEKPEHYYPIVSADFGFKDHTGVLFGWVDFLTQKLVCKEEIFVNYTTPGEIAKECLIIAARVFPDHSIEDIKWFADAPLMVLGEIRKQTGLAFGMVQKHDKDANVALIRTQVQNGKIQVDEECRNLLLQLDKAVYNKTRTDWERTVLWGHCDLLAALIYMNKMAPWKRNPTPSKSLNIERQFIKDGESHNPWNKWSTKVNG